MKRDEVIWLAEAAAAFLRNLLDEGVPLESATSLTAAFVTSSVLKGQESERDVRRPWEDV